MYVSHSFIVKKVCKKFSILVQEAGHAHHESKSDIPMYINKFRMHVYKQGD